MEPAEVADRGAGSPYRSYKLILQSALALAHKRETYYLMVQTINVDQYQFRH